MLVASTAPALAQTYIPSDPKNLASTTGNYGVNYTGQAGSSGWYLISGDEMGYFYGYKWTGTAWQSDSEITSGLYPGERNSAPTVFQKDGTWYLISGEEMMGFRGYKWTGTTWQSDDEITSGLDYHHEFPPTSTVFQKDGTWYLISGEEMGFYGYKWTGTAWQSDDEITSGLDYHSWWPPTPTVFDMGGNIAPEIELVKTASPSSGAPSTNVNFTIVVTNTGDCTLDPVKLVDTLPTGLSYVSSSSAVDSLVGSTLTWNNVGPISASNSKTIYLIAHIDAEASGILNNTANATGTPPTGDDVTDDAYYKVTALILPNITSSAPESPVNDTYGTWTKFNVSVDQIVNVTWYLNGIPQTPVNESVTEANYTFHANNISEHNVSALAEDANGTDMQTWVWNVRETTPPVITIDAPTPSSPANRTGGEQFYVNFTYTELHPANYTVTVGNATAVIHSTTNDSPPGGTDRIANESFYLNASAVDGWYNVTVEMYDNSSNYNITHQNKSVEKGYYDASISQPENQATEPGVNATYELNITNTGSFRGTFALAVTNHGGADVAVLNQTTIANLAVDASQNVTLNVTGASAGTYNVTVNVTSTYSGSEVASTGYIMTTVVGPTLTIDNVTSITSDWGINFNLNHSVAVTNATASNVNLTYNVSWITDNDTMGTIAKDGMKWHNQTRSNLTVQKITVRVDADTTTASATNDSETFSINITRRDITVTANPRSEQTAGVGDIFWINGSAKGEYDETFIGKAYLIRDGSIIDNKTITDGNANFSRTEPAEGTFNFSIRFHNTTYYDNASTSNSTVTVRGPTLALGNVTALTSDWGINFSVSHSVRVNNATASNVNVTYNVSWIDGCAFGTVNKDATEWCNHSIKNSSVQNLMVKVDATATTGSAMNDTETFSILITRRNITVTADPGSEQTAGVGETFWINGSAKDEHNEAFFAEADLIRDGIIVNTAVTNGNANFSTNESAAGTSNFSIRFHNTTHYNNASTSNKTVTVRGPTLTLDNVTSITSDWGINFNLNHSVTVTNATASSVNVTYNVSWITDNNTMGTIAEGGMKWHNQSIENLTVQKITVKVDANTTTASATNDTGTFSISITRRAIIITADPITPQSVNPNTTFWINGSAEWKYGETFTGKACLIRDGSIIDNKTTTGGNANFSRTEPAEGTFNFSIKFYNTTHYNNKTTSNATIHIVDTTPPASITDLDNPTTEQSRIHWTWTDPTDNDFAKVRIYLDGTFKTNVSKGAGNYIATGLDPDTNYTIGMHTVDDKGNINQTRVNDTARTLPFSPLKYINVTPTAWTLNISEFVNFNATGYDHNNDSIDDLVFGWGTTPPGVGTLNNSTGSVVNFTARHAGRTVICAVNGSVTDSVWITVNTPPETGNVANGTGNATSGNSTAIVMLNDTSVNGTIIIEELGDPLNRTEDIGNRTGLGTDSEPVKGVNVTVNKSIVAALNDTGGYVHIRVEYNESQLGGIDENTLYIYKFVNGTGWVKLVAGNPSYCIANGRNTTANYVWVNVTECSIFLLAGTGVTTPTPSGAGGGEGTYPPGWFDTPAPDVTATKAPAASATGTATDAPLGERVTPAPTKKPAAARATAPAAEGTTAGGAKKGAPGFTAVFVIAGMLVALYAVMRRRV